MKKKLVHILIQLTIGIIFQLTQNLSAQQISVHDPVMIREGKKYFLFCTGNGISVWSSPDLKIWMQEAPVFSKVPDWAITKVPGFKGHIWAPDISFHNGQYYLYYSVSAFGKNTSCIGLTTNITLDSSNPEFKWVDHGPVVQSVPGRDLWNAIDPNLVIGADSIPWLAFGSFWNGIKLVKLTNDLTRIDNPEQWFTIAVRERTFGLEDTNPGDGAIEAPFIFKKGQYYYLFVSWDYCCRGPKSNYKIVVGRSKDVQGPYLDKEEKPMDQGGGTVLLEGNDKWYGIGHNSTYTFGDSDYLVCHAYDVSNKGKPVLIIKKLSWDNDAWPIINE